MTSNYRDKMKNKKTFIYKSGIALLLTIFFIIALSVIMLQILDKNEKLIDNSSFDLQLSKTNLLIKDIQNEAIKYLKNFSDIDENLPITVPLHLKDINILFEIELVDDFILIDDKNLFKKDEIINNIEFIYDFKQLLKGKKIDSFYQIDYLVKEYKTKTKDKKIDSIKDKFIYNKIKKLKYKIAYRISDTQIDLYLDKKFNILDRYIRAP